ncbi:MAG TPA: glycoside hydrolase family 16 protein [Bryobacteraceae bacterium]|nr:glycoside hydrolase family 16 protein [Bryobacteraceae bacterium]
MVRLLIQAGAGILFLSLPVFPQSPKWTLTFAEEFDGKELSFPKWMPHDPWGHERNREGQAYVPDAIEVKDGVARITARRARATYDGREREFTSGMMTTFGSFAQTYGRFEIRCHVPAGRGVEPKFWLLPVPTGEIPSIDVLDVIGSEPSRALFANRWGDEKTERSFSGSYNVGDLSNGFHTIAIDWDENRIVWFVDGKERFRSTDGVPRQPMYLAASLAVGGIQAKYPDQSVPFPAVFEIDFIRVYQLESRMTGAR